MNVGIHKPLTQRHIPEDPNPLECELVKEHCCVESNGFTALFWVRLTFSICVLQCPMFGSLLCPYKPAPLPLVIDPIVVLPAGSECYFMQHNSAIAGA